MLRSLLITFLILTSSCTELVAVKPVPLPLPIIDLLPRVKDVELSCLSTDTRIKMQVRETVFRGHINTLEAVIKSTW